MVLQGGRGGCSRCMAVTQSGMQDTPLEATHWGRWARQLPLRSAVPLLVTPPVIGGLLVGALRAASGFDSPPATADTTSASRAGSNDDAALRDRTASASTSGKGGGGGAPLGRSPLWWARQKARRCPGALRSAPRLVLAW